MNIAHETDMIMAGESLGVLAEVNLKTVHGWSGRSTGRVSGVTMRCRLDISLSLYYM